MAEEADVSTAVDKDNEKEGRAWVRAFQTPAVWQSLVDDMDHHHYNTVCWAPWFYSVLCYYGFISVAQEPTFLMPELQLAYSVLDFANLHVGKKVRQRANRHKYRLTINKAPDAVWRRVHKYHSGNWLEKRYFAMLRAMWDGMWVPTLEHAEQAWFRPHTVELWDTETDELVAGEIGYVVGHVYTSLTGFFSASHPSAGKIQLTSLALYLQTKGIHFLSLGHPPMGDLLKYKTEIGGEVISRADFLEKWSKSRHGKVDIVGEVDVPVKKTDPVSA
eukprot:Rhum_TRINITY_DN17181_c0_g1::Rhum_TRINITY_DN17181_c0_g1_i1::g.165442::m.165442